MPGVGRLGPICHARNAQEYPRLALPSQRGQQSGPSSIDRNIHDAWLSFMLVGRCWA